MDSDEKIEHLARELARTTVMSLEEAREQLQRIANAGSYIDMALFDDRPVRLVPNRADRRRAARKDRA